MDDFSRETKTPGPSEISTEDEDLSSAASKEVRYSKEEKDVEEARSKQKATFDALAKADAVLMQNGESRFGGGGASSIPPKIDGSGSLRDVIDRVEKQLMTSFEEEDQKNNPRPEELDVLDIEAELGRPDPGAQRILDPHLSLGDKEDGDARDPLHGSRSLGEEGHSSQYEPLDFDEDPVSGDYSSLVPLAPSEFKEPQVGGWNSSGDHNFLPRSTTVAPTLHGANICSSDGSNE